MNRKGRYLQAGVIAVLATAMTLPAAACGGGDDNTDRKYDPETRPLVMSISTPDGVFNPFFGTSSYDTTLVSLTQIGMLGSDSEGKIVYGDNEPVVVKDYRSTVNAAEDTTTYEFILKNGIKFSNGSPLTIKDVLFNLYTYLDPAYTGSATIYSTKIVGLEAYRTQNPQATEGSMESFEEGFYTDANKRISDLIDFVYVYGCYSGTSYTPSKDTFTPEEQTSFKKDFDTVAKEFKKELETDWNTSAESRESYKDWGITETWEIFLLNDGGETELLKKNPDGTYKKDENGNFQIDTEGDDYQVAKADLETWIAENDDYSMNDEGKKAWALDRVYTSYFRNTLETTPADGFRSILTGWATADTIRDQFAAEAKSEHFASLGGSRPVKKIEGIDGTGTTTKDFSGKDLGASHEVLKIKIRGVDPKAVWNFGFTVAPMYYYSTNNYNGKDYIASFNEAEGEFGLAFGDLDFMNNVINAPEKVGLPVGAGMYMASNQNGGSGTVNSDTFFDKNMVYYERNPYFETLGSGISNAKIKYVKYKVVESDQIINSLGTGEIDFGEPSGTQENITALNNKGIAHVEVKTNGYGYVGINPRYVPDITVRRAIMRAMNKSIITQNYYKGDLAELIERPMSNTSWAYPKDATVYKNEAKGLDYSFDATGLLIEDMIEDAGYVKNGNGIYQRDIPGFGTHALEYTFTIAGSTSDHPAYAMFNEAAKLLNAHGFKIKVVTSQTALSDLTTGKLTVWAAAWSSTIDPDMYQVYHKDSLATSVNNWGYRQIKANKTLYATEWALIQTLSDLIDDGRSTLDETERALIYKDALDVVMELAVEFPTYQRKDMSAYNSDLLDRNTMTANPTAYEGLLARMWELNYN